LLVRREVLLRKDENRMVVERVRDVGPRRLVE
jgi:hypothetical protein